MLSRTLLSSITTFLLHTHAHHIDHISLRINPQTLGVMTPKLFIWYV